MPRKSHRRAAVPSLENRKPFNCPCCHTPVDAKREAEEKKEMEEATPSKRKVLENEHIASHAGALRGRLPIFPIDHKWRSRGVLHRRMNVTSNCCAATILSVPFNESKRRRMNEKLDAAKLIWRVPETAGKRSKSISAGNDSRIMLSHPTLLKDLLEIAYEEQVSSRTSRQGVASGGVTKKAPAKKAGGGKKVVVDTPVLTVGSKEVTAKEVATCPNSRARCRG